MKKKSNISPETHSNMKKKPNISPETHPNMKKNSNISPKTHPNIKKKSKLYSDIASLVLAKSKAYIKEDTKSDSESDEANNAKVLRKATAADKERKREKMRLKKKMKRDAKAKSAKQDNSAVRKSALNYLRLWNSSREQWSFKKKQQVWLLKNAFNSSNITDDDFEILLNYLIDLKGEAKKRLTEESERVIKEQEEKAQNSQSTVDINVFERARNILQILV